MRREGERYIRGPPTVIFNDLNCIAFLLTNQFVSQSRSTYSVHYVNGSQLLLLFHILRDIYQRFDMDAMRWHFQMPNDKRQFVSTQVATSTTYCLLIEMEQNILLMLCICPFSDSNCSANLQNASRNKCFTNNNNSWMDAVAGTSDCRNKRNEL